MMKSSIKTRITMVFICIMVLLLVLCLGLNNFLLKDFYYQKKQEKFVKYYKELSDLVVQDDENDKISTLLAQMRDSDNISFIRVAADWTVDENSANCVSMEQAKKLTDRLIGYIVLKPESFKSVSVIKRTEEYAMLHSTYDDGGEYMECYGLLDDGYMFIMSTPLEAVADSVSISNQFLLFTCLGVMILAVIIISVITGSLTRPILQLAQLSDKMAHLDFTSSYTGSLDNEIGILGSSMNSMSRQLESTINQLKSANEQLKKDIDEKIQIDEVRKEFLSNVSHELKTPIALIQGYAEGLQDSVNDDPESRAFYCDVIVDEADKMNRMVRKLLTLNHLEFGQDALSQDEFDIAEMVSSLIDSNAINMQKKNLTAQSTLPSPCMVIGDEFKIEEVCTNYISNAINHAEEGSIIDIMSEDLGSEIRFTVKNKGHHIPEESLDKVWIKFYKVDKARTREYGGSGIGLSIVKAIMDAHGEGYGVYNTDDGVAFWFCLKKAQERADDQNEDDN